MSNVSGAESIKLDIWVFTNAVVANWVVFVDISAVGAVGIPVSCGDSNGALVAIFVIFVAMSVAFVKIVFLSSSVIILPDPASFTSIRSVTLEFE